MSWNGVPVRIVFSTTRGRGGWRWGTMMVRSWAVTSVMPSSYDDGGEEELEDGEVATFSNSTQSVSYCLSQSQDL